MRAEPGGDEEAADVRFAEDELVVGGEALGAVDHPVDARVGDRRDAPDRAGHDLLEARPIGRQELAVEVGRDAVERPRRRMSLVAAHAQPADLFAEVDEIVRVAELREARVDAVHRLGEEVLVRHRDDRDGDAHHPAELGREHPGGVDDDVGADLAPLAVVLDGHAGDPTALRPDRHHTRVRADLRTAAARAGGQRVREPGRVQPAVRRQVDGAEHGVGRHQREARPRLGRADQLERQAEGLGPARLAAQLLEPLRAGGQSERSDLMPRRIGPGLGGEAPVQVGPVHHHLGQRHRAPQLADEPRGVERGARRELGAVDQDDVRPAELGQVVGDARAADATADDDRPGVLRHRGSPLPSRSDRRRSG